MSYYTLCIVGLGYVGLPLAVEFSKKRKVFGFDVNTTRVEELKEGFDRTKELSSSELRDAKDIVYTDSIQDLKNIDIFIITVPTPIDSHNEPDLSPLINACKSIGPLLVKGNIVVFESTVYPGATEEVCVPILEKFSKLQFNSDFFCGYSPERINPGDKINNLKTIKKVTSGSNAKVAKIIDSLYSEIIEAGTYLAPSIKVAEAAKVIENTQRDINIALINELALIFDKLDIDTEEVLKAAETKWNFLPFRPGLVGGHCIGVDPYYLTYKALEVGYNPEMILAGRRINNSISSHITSKLAKLMLQKRINIIDSKILIMGYTFKENCPDTRNTKVQDIIDDLKSMNTNVEVFDPVADITDIEKNVNFIKRPKEKFYDAIIIAVAHNEFLNKNRKYFEKYTKANSVIFDVKYLLDINESDGRL